jgi:hypothetical protein
VVIMRSVFPLQIILRFERFAGRKRFFKTKQNKTKKKTKTVMNHTGYKNLQRFFPTDITSDQKLQPNVYITFILVRESINFLKISNFH